MIRPKRSHCRHGHEYTPENIYVSPKTGAIGCKICRKIARSKIKTRYNGESGIERKFKYMFGGKRELAIIRDGEKCVKCGMTREEHKQIYKRDITVDHIDGRGLKVPANMKNNSLDNLQTLCMPCHGRKDGARGKKFSDLPVESKRRILQALKKGHETQSYDRPPTKPR